MKNFIQMSCLAMLMMVATVATAQKLEPKNLQTESSTANSRQIGTEGTKAISTEGSIKQAQMAREKRIELQKATRRYNLMATRVSRIKQTAKQSKSKFIGSSVYWYNPCNERKGVLFYFPPTHILQKSYQGLAAIGAKFRLIGKKKKLEKYRDEVALIKGELENIQH